MLAGDVAQELGWLAEGGGNLDQLAGAGAAVERAGAVLAVLALDRGYPGSEAGDCGDLEPARRGARCSPTMAFDYILHR